MSNEIEEYTKLVNDMDAHLNHVENCVAMSNYIIESQDHDILCNHLALFYVTEMNIDYDTATCLACEHSSTKVKPKFFCPGPYKQRVKSLVEKFIRDHYATKFQTIINNHDQNVDDWQRQIQGNYNTMLKE
jgi:hypothetical protein